MNAMPAATTATMESWTPDNRPRRCGLGDRVLRALSWLLMVTMTNLSRSPLAAAQGQAQKAAQAAGRQTAADVYAWTLVRLRDVVLADSNKPELSATLDAPHSADIKALALELGNAPYRIHQWVHDNIRFFPTYGSVQGAQETLAKRSGNAFDIASLLIALLRSASFKQYTFTKGVQP
ncbi:MAG: transglutaminase-like domain-containing protein [Azoarcus sp.]|jgi:hypothetical protein|nr:transglutaminase-like domain-containing protein [Azoarcus sp.]